MIRIKIEGKNIADLWQLECVRQIAKDSYGRLVVSVDVGWLDYAYVGDTIEVESEQSKTGSIIYQGR